MRLSNVIIGVLLAIAIAYVHDSSMSAVSPDGHPQNLVNWQVFGRLAQDAYDWMRRTLGLI